MQLRSHLTTVLGFFKSTTANTSFLSVNGASADAPFLFYSDTPPYPSASPLMRSAPACDKRENTGTYPLSRAMEGIGSAFLAAHRYIACIGHVKQAGFEPAIADNQPFPADQLPHVCSTGIAPGPLQEPLLRAEAYLEKRERRGVPYAYRDVEGGAGFEPTTSGCARRRASESTSRPYRRRIGGR